jgi:hypothetical protein
MFRNEWGVIVSPMVRSSGHDDVRHERALSSITSAARGICQSWGASQLIKRFLLDRVGDRPPAMVLASIVSGARDVCAGGARSSLVPTPIARELTDVERFAQLPPSHCDVDPIGELRRLFSPSSVVQARL